MDGGRVRCIGTAPDRSGALRLGALSLLDLDYLTTVVHAAIGADMVGPLQLAAVAALDKIEGLDVVMPASIALTVPANALFW